MKKMVLTASEKAGLPPGSVVLVAEKAEPTKITLIDYDRENLDVRELGDVEDAFPLRRTSRVTWLNICGLRDIDIIERLGREYGLHPLILEDIVHLNQRPKVEVFDDYVFAVVKMIRIGDGGELDMEQVSIVIGDTFALTFQEKEGDVLDPLRERIAKDKGRIRKLGADYLGYAILDSIVDQYFAVVEKFEEALEGLEDETLRDDGEEVIGRLHILRSDLLSVRRYVSPMREAISTLVRTSDGIIKEETLPYLSDLYDHVLRMTEALDILRESVSGLRELHLANLSNRMNAVMKMLTVIATIFIPLTFIAGIYGMNFEYMPELKWRWGYFAVWAVMVAIAVGMIRYFRKKDWF